MRIAIPVVQGELSRHFGHCESFAFFDTDESNTDIVASDLKESPEHQPGLLPRWLAENGATVIIAGGMGNRAQILFQEQGIEVIVGVSPEAPEKIAKQYLAGELEAGENICDH